MRPQTVLKILSSSTYLADKACRAYNEDDIGNVATLLAMEPIEVIESLLERRIRKPSSRRECGYAAQTSDRMGRLQGLQMVLENQ